MGGIYMSRETRESDLCFLQSNVDKSQLGIAFLADVAYLHPYRSPIKKSKRFSKKQVHAGFPQWVAVKCH